MNPYMKILEIMYNQVIEPYYSYVIDDIPIKKKTGIGYDTFLSWKKILHSYTTTHGLFFPHERAAYAHWYFLMKTPYDLSAIINEWPASCMLIELGAFVLLTVPVNNPHGLLTLLHLLEILRDKSVIMPRFHAVALDSQNGIHNK
jgi:hypothetical protein